MKEIKSLKEISKYLKISESTIRKLVKEKNIPYFRIGYRIKFDLEEINNWIGTLSEKESKNNLFF